jgi:membrane protein YqaA with SNARE-associated domain
VHALVVWTQNVLVPWLGPAGLFVVCFLDASFLSLPEISDLLVIAWSATDPGTAWVAVLTAAAGSVAGCSALWALGRRGGEALLTSRFGEGRVAWARDAFRRWHMLALAVPALLPPPMPFKIFVLSAGVFAVPYRRFALTLFAARGVRYVFWAILGAAYGPAATEWLKGLDAWFGPRLPWLLGASALLGGAALLAARLRRARAPVPEPE